MARRLENFITAFEQYAQIYNTVDRYRTIGGVFLVSTAAKRSIAMQARGNILHPNMYFQLIGGPSAGKSQAIKAVMDIILPATDFSIIPASITRAGMEDYMKDNLKTRTAHTGSMMMSSECIGISEEMQGILPDQDLGHLTLYNILYDNPNIHRAVTRSHGEIKLEEPFCAILTGAQPAFLATTMPEQAWGMGFMSRTMMVFGVQGKRISAFDTITSDQKLKADLIHDLKEIFNLSGWVKWDKQAIALYEQWWVVTGGAPIPTAKRLVMGYNGRRELHMLKLAITMSLAESNEMLVKEHHVAAAIKLLLDLEAQTRHIFNEMSSTGSTVALSDVLESVKRNWADGEKLTPESDLITLLMQRFPSTQVHSLIENLVSSGALEDCSSINAKGFRKFKPGARSGG